MSLNTHNAARPRRISEGPSSGKRGRPESIVRQFWQDIDAPGVGPKCIFCDHRSMTRVFRAPPATRHTLICKNAPEEVKAQLRRVTNNKYSRRRPMPNDNLADPKLQTTPSPPQQQQQQHPSHQFSHFKPPQHQPAHAAAHADAPLPNLTSPRHISANVVSNLPAQQNMTQQVDSSQPLRTTLLTDPRTVQQNPRTIPLQATATPVQVPTASLSASADMLYATAPTQRMLHSAEELASSVSERAHAALTAAVVEAMFPQGSARKKEGAIPTPAEFRAALLDIKEVARSKAKRQRNEARAECTRLHNAISLLVASPVVTSSRGVEPVESDDSGDDSGVQGSAQGAGRRSDWSNGYDRSHK